MTRKEKAEELFRTGYNCSQSVIGAFCDDFALDFKTVMKLSEGFGGGFGRMRLTCGAVSGMVMAVGMLISNADPKEDTRKEVYAKVHKLCDLFKEKNGSIICADLLGLTSNTSYSAKPEERNSEYYQKRPCVDCVKDCVELIENEFGL